jgi:hypothetical protein
MFQVPEKSGMRFSVAAVVASNGIAAKNAAANPPIAAMADTPIAPESPRGISGIAPDLAVGHA